jgi:hypothetical protein
MRVDMNLRMIMDSKLCHIKKSNFQEYCVPTAKLLKYALTPLDGKMHNQFDHVLIDNIRISDILP